MDSVDDKQYGDGQQFLGNEASGGLDNGIGSGMRTETAGFLNDLAGIGTGAYLEMTQAETPEYQGWRDGNFVSDGSGNYVSREGQTYSDDDLQRMHNVLSQEAGNPLVSQLFDGPKSPWANYLTWRNQNYGNKSAVGGAWEDEDGTLYSEPALQEMFGMKFAAASEGTLTGANSSMNEKTQTRIGKDNNKGSGFSISQIPFFKPKDVPLPPSAPPPGVPSFAFDQARINKLTVEQVAGIVFNENRDVMPGDSTPEELQAAKTAQAHAVINGDRNLGSRRPRTATWKVPDRLKKSPQYEQALTAARTAFQEANVGIDSTGSRIHFNNRYDDADLDAPWMLDNGQFQPFHHYGPFKLGKRAVWTLIYDDSK